MDIDALWDYDRPEESESRFREAIECADSAQDIAELKTQLARSLGLQRRFEEAHQVLDELEPVLDGAGAPVRVRYFLERGRVLNSSGKPEEAKPLFLQAYEQAEGLEFLRADAAHMVAIVASGDEAIEWNERTILLADRTDDPRARTWVVSGRNNLGWTYYGLGRFDEALSQFEAAAELRRSGPLKEFLIARYCVAKTWRAMGRYQEALQEQLELAAANRELDSSDGFVQEEIGECLLALGRPNEAKPHFGSALDQLSKIAWIAADEPERIARIRQLAGSS